MSDSSEKKISPFGTWESPISAESIASGNYLFDMKLSDEDIYCVEVRPKEEGRYAILKISQDGRVSELTLVPFNVRSTVHEYGGGAFAVSKGTLYFSNFSDQRIYEQQNSGTPIPITVAGVDTRYADGVVDQSSGRLICVREQHPVPGKRDANNSIVSVDIRGDKETVVLAGGNDFYAFPRLNSDGSKIAWITWNFPNMPFDGTELWVGLIDGEGHITQKKKIAGGFDESVTQPRWSPSGDLYFISDRSGWWNLYRWRGGNIETLCPKSADFCHPDWHLGLSSYALESDELVVCSYSSGGTWRLAMLDAKSLGFEDVNCPYTEFQHLEASRGYAVFFAASPTESFSVFRFDVSSGQFRRLYSPPGDPTDSAYLSLPSAIDFPTNNGVKAHAFHYPPKNPSYIAPAGELPPLIVSAHGGPTHAASTEMNGGILFWTSRGFAVLDVNYGGSSNYGREYRRRLNGQWGVVDVDDCANGAHYLVKEGLVDGKRIVIRGGSAGGFTTFCSLAFKRLFRAGASYYGISDLEHWELEAHKFESQYLHSLIGAYPEERELYLERSAARNSDNVSTPLIIFHGLGDKVVPPNQSQMIYEELRRRKLTVQLFMFEGEQHNFRRAENIEKAYEAELSFFSRSLGLKAVEVL